MAPDPPASAPAVAQRPDGGRASGLVAAGILLSRVTGLVRERAVGHFFGTGYAADAFTAANRIPNILQNLLGEGVLSASIIPGYSRLLARGGARTPAGWRGRSPGCCPPWWGRWCC